MGLTVAMTSRLLVRAVQEFLVWLPWASTGVGIGIVLPLAFLLPALVPPLVLELPVPIELKTLTNSMVLLVPPQVLLVLMAQAAEFVAEQTALVLKVALEKEA
jgi:hypothetical protein